MKITWELKHKHGGGFQHQRFIPDTNEAVDGDPILFDAHPYKDGTVIICELLNGRLETFQKITRTDGPQVWKCTVAVQGSMSGESISIGISSARVQKIILTDEVDDEAPAADQD